MSNQNNERWLPGFEPRKTNTAPQDITGPQQERPAADFEKEIKFLFDEHTQSIYFGNIDKWDEPYDRSDKNEINSIFSLTDDERGPAIVTLKNKRVFFTSQVDGTQTLKRIKEFIGYDKTQYPPETPIPEKYLVTPEKIQEFLKTNDFDVFGELEF